MHSKFQDKNLRVRFYGEASASQNFALSVDFVLWTLTRLLRYCAACEKSLEQNK